MPYGPKSFRFISMYSLDERSLLIGFPLVESGAGFPSPSPLPSGGGYGGLVGRPVSRGREVVGSLVGSRDGTRTELTIRVRADLEVLALLRGTIAGIATPLRARLPANILPTPTRRPYLPDFNAAGREEPLLRGFERFLTTPAGLRHSNEFSRPISRRVL